MLTNNTDHIASPPGGISFSSLYLDTRKKEGRLYSDEQTAQLPATKSSDLHHSEWKVRARSAARLFRYLSGKNRPLSLLEVGCGNGWLSARLSALEHSRVTGIDINALELDQAARVFRNRHNLHFYKRSLYETAPHYDVIVFAASIQYFPSFAEVMRRALSLLNGGGEIHILDSLFYKPQQLAGAIERSREYYRGMGQEALAAFYFHHEAAALDVFNHHYLFDPRAYINRMFRRQDIFPWIRIRP